MPYKKIFEIAEKVSARGPCWTQGPGGNISEKKDNSLLIKASGFRLDEICSQSAICRIETGPFLRQLFLLFQKDSLTEQAYADLIKKSSQLSIVNKAGLRASMETGFHALLQKTYVIHFHSCTAVLMAHQSAQNPEEWKQFCESNQDIRLEIVPFIKPGLELCKYLYQAKSSSAYILANHGIILHTESPISSLNRWLEFELDFCNKFHYRILYELLSKPIWSSKDWMKLEASPWKIYFPDTAVFQKRISKILRGDKLKSIDFESWESDPCASELWAATQLLHSICPELTSIEGNIAKTVADLPTEKARQEINLAGA